MDFGHVDASWGSPQHRQRLKGLATQLAGVADALEGELVFVPHVGGESVPDGRADMTVGRKLAELLGDRLTLLDIGTPAEVRGLAGEAALVISTRYHPLVFAVAAGVPAIGIHADEYTRVKLQGAMAHAGQVRWTVGADAAANGQLLPMALELWQRREAVSAASRAAAGDARRDAQARWKEIGNLLGVETAPSYEGRRTPEGSKSSQPGAGTMSSILSESDWQEYEAKGYLRLGRVLDDAALAALQRRIDEIMLGRVAYPQLQFQMDTGGAYGELPDPVNGLITSTLAYRKVQGLEADPLFLALLRQDLFREICARHYGAHAAVSIFRAMMMNKPANQGTYLPWHQDAGDVWKLDRDPEVTLWVALDPATKANGCVQVVPGTHRLGLLSKNGSTISDENVARHCPDSAVEYLEIGAGEGLLLHNWLVHRSDVNRTDRPRRAFTACYMDGRTLNTLTGARFPIIFGEYEDVEDAMLFVRAMNEDNRNLRKTAEEATRYAKSLEEAVLHMRSKACARDCVAAAPLKGAFSATGLRSTAAVDAAFASASRTTRRATRRCC